LRPKPIDSALKEYVDAWRAGGYYFYGVRGVFNEREYLILDMSIDEFIGWLYEQTPP